MDKLIGKGIRFRCLKGCSRCCRGQGYVWINPSEADLIADFLGIGVEIFLGKYTKECDGHITLKDDASHEQCIFLDSEGRCPIYEVRPVQCRTYPFWKSVFKDRESMNYEFLECPGLGTGKLFAKEKILDLFKQTEDIFGD